MSARPFYAAVAVSLALLLAACSSSSHVDRERLESLRNDPMADYEPPTGESISYTEEAGRRFWVLDHGWQEEWSVIASQWWVTISEEEASVNLAKALDSAGWDLEGTPEELTFPVRVTRQEDGYCVAFSASYTDPEDRGRMRLELAAPYSASESDPCDY